MNQKPDNKIGNLVLNLLLSILPIIALVFLQGFVSVIGSLILLAWDFSQLGIDNTREILNLFYNQYSNVNILMSIMTVYSIAGMILFGLWYKICRKDAATPSRTKYSPVLIVSMPILALAMQYITNYLVMILNLFFPDQLVEYNEMIESMGLGSNVEVSLPLVLAIIILGPVCEELCCRGVAFHYASKVLPFWAANIFQAVLFGLMHMNLIQGCYAFAFGLVLGYLYHVSGNILIPCILHVLFNGISVFTDYFYFGEENPYIFCFVLFLAMSICYWSIMATANGTSEQDKN